MATGDVEVIAPEGFMHHAIAENVFAGPAMTRRAGYMYGAAPERGPAGQIGTGLGQATPKQRHRRLAVRRTVVRSVAIRMDGPRAWDEHLVIAWVVTHEDTTYVVELRNGALNHRVVAGAPNDVTTFTLTRRALIGLVTGAPEPSTAIRDGTVAVDGDPIVLERIVALLAPVDPNFDVLTP